MADKSKRRPHWQPDTSRPADDATLQSARSAIQQQQQQEEASRQTTQNKKNNKKANEPATKKARFDIRNPSRLAAEETNEDDEDNDNLDLDLDEIGRKGMQGKRSGVEIDGYDTDSSDDNFDTRAEDRAQLKKDLEKEATAGKGAAAAADDDDDMFADSDGSDDDGGGDDDDDDQDQAAARRRDKRAVKFLDDDEIEGEEEMSRSGGHISLNKLKAAREDMLDRHTSQPGFNNSDDDDDDSDDSGDDESRAKPEPEIDEELGVGSKKKNAPKLDAFNMKAEQEEGRFDTGGNFIRNAADPDADHDNWLDGLSRKDMRRAREAHQQRTVVREDGEDGDGNTSNEALLGVLIRYLPKGDTVLETLADLGMKKSKLVPKGGKFGKGRSWNKSKVQDNGGKSEDVDITFSSSTATADSAHQGTTTTGENPNAAKIKELVDAIQQITEAADRLLSQGMLDVYDSPRESIMRSYLRQTGHDWVEESTGAKKGEDQNDDDEGESDGGVDKGIPVTGDETMWKFRWTEGPSAGQVQGPYNASTMTSWLQAGFFANSTAIEFLLVGDGVEQSEEVSWIQDVTDFDVRKQ